MHAQAAIQKRAVAAGTFRPDRVRLLLVAEAPPCDTSRYFYFDNVPNHDWLYVYVCRGLFGEVEIADLRGRKRAYLAALCSSGVFMIDLAPEGMSNPTVSKLRPPVAGMVERCAKLRPESIVLIKSSVYDVSFAALQAAGLPVIDVRMPFPASGQQPEFLKRFASALKRSGMRTPLRCPSERSGRREA